MQCGKGLIAGLYTRLRLNIPFMMKSWTFALCADTWFWSNQENGYGKRCVRFWNIRIWAFYFRFQRKRHRYKVQKPWVQSMTKWSCLKFMFLK
jgi:hypothetical protein